MPGIVSSAFVAMVWCDLTNNAQYLNRVLGGEIDRGCPGKGRK